MDCRDCGKQGLVWGKTKTKKPMLMELRPHFITCKKKREKPLDPPAVLALLELGYKVMEARRAVKGLRGDDESKVVLALQRLTEGG